MKRWLRKIWLLPFWVLMGNIDGDTGAIDDGDAGTDTGDAGDTGANDQGDGIGDDPVTDDGLDNRGADDQGSDQQQDRQQPLIPRKAYESEKEKRQTYQTENEQLKARLAQLEQAAPRQEQKPPATIEEAFDQNPSGTLAYLDQEIRKARSEYDTDKVTELVDLKATLATRGLLQFESRQSTAAQRAKLDAEIYKVAPDFDTKKSELIQTAKEMGFDEQTAADLFNPDVIGPAAIQAIKAFSRVNAMLNAGKTAKGKEVKTPMKTEPAGNGGFSNNDQSKQQFNRAKESGKLDDWAAILG